MKLEQQCISLDIARRLKELGVKQESLFMWCFMGLSWKVQKVSDGDFSAFTVAELGEMLPKKIVKDDKEYFISQVYTMLDFPMIRYTDADGYDFISWHSTTEADARGKMLIYLLENGLLTNPT